MENKEEFWKQTWIRHLDQYLSRPPRAGYWIASQFKSVINNSAENVLEIAAGSCRDAKYLSKFNVAVTASDFDRTTLEHVKNKFTNYPIKIEAQDGFGFTYCEGEFALSFHNGFWVLFSDDDIRSLLREQSRITESYIVGLCHNSKNYTLMEKFARQSESDSIYDIRFFSPRELVDIVVSSGITYKKIRIEKFGGKADRLYSILSRFGRLGKTVASCVVPRLYRLQPWRWTERIAVVVEK